MSRYHPKVAPIQIAPMCLCVVGHLEYACPFATAHDIEADIVWRAKISSNE